MLFIPVVVVLGGSVVTVVSPTVESVVVVLGGSVVTVVSPTVESVVEMVDCVDVKIDVVDSVKNKYRF